MIPRVQLCPPYVWSSYGLFAVIVAWQAIVPQLLRRRRILAELAEEAAMQKGNYHDPRRVEAAWPSSR